MTTPPVPEGAPRSRLERLIAAGRVVLAGASLFAVWLDPSEPAKYARIAYLLLAAYLSYSVVVALWVGRFGPPGHRGRLFTHLFDLLLFSLFIYFTAGPGSPFIAFFAFSLVCATVRWGWRGTLWTAATALAALVAVSVYFGLVVREPDFQLHLPIIRGVYLLVMAVLLGYLGAHEERTRRERAQLAAWAAATEERIRLARDLHDGVLQSFTGVALRLAAVRRRLDEDPAAARDGLEAVQRLLASEQRDLRFFISELAPSPGAAAGGAEGLPARLSQLAERMEREWGLKVELTLAANGEVPEALGREVYLLAREALVNAVRHGGASEVRVALEPREGTSIALTVADNGHGFPFDGHLDAEAMERSGQGPKSLRRRLVALGGTLVVDSGPRGARLEMTLPGTAEAGPPGAAEGAAGEPAR